VDPKLVSILEVDIDIAPGAEKVNLHYDSFFKVSMTRAKADS
jgi:hypothetical protein